MCFHNVFGGYTGIIWALRCFLIFWLWCVCACMTFGHRVLSWCVCLWMMSKLWDVKRVRVCLFASSDFLNCLCIVSLLWWIASCYQTRIELHCLPDTGDSRGFSPGIIRVLNWLRGMCGAPVAAGSSAFGEKTCALAAVGSSAFGEKTCAPTRIRRLSLPRTFKLAFEFWEVKFE